MAEFKLPKNSTYKKGKVWASDSDITRVKRFNRSEEHTSELQSRSDLVCRLLLEKKKEKKKKKNTR